MPAFKLHIDLVHLEKLKHTINHTGNNIIMFFLFFSFFLFAFIMNIEYKRYLKDIR